MRTQSILFCVENFSGEEVLQLSSRSLSTDIFFLWFFLTSIAEIEVVR